MHAVGTLLGRSPFLRSSVPPFLLASSPFPARSPRRSSSLVVSLVPFFARHGDWSPRPGCALRLLRYKLQGPGTVEIIKRRPAFGATSGIRVGALYSRHYPPRKLGRDETAFLSPSSSHRLSLSLSLSLCTSSCQPSPLSQLPFAVLPAPLAATSPVPVLLSLYDLSLFLASCLLRSSLFDLPRFSRGCREVNNEFLTGGLRPDNLYLGNGISFRDFSTSSSPRIVRGFANEIVAPREKSASSRFCDIATFASRTVHTE